MNVIPPITITDSVLVSSSLAEPGPGETAWVSGTTYAIGDVRIRTSTHRQYQRLTAGAGTTPPESDTTNWIDIGPTNKWAMFDTLRSSASVSSGNLVLKLVPTTRIDSLAFLQMSAATSLEVTVVSNSITVYSASKSLQIDFTGWYEYFFDTLVYNPTAVFFDIPPYSTNEINITMVGSAPSVGVITLGKYVNLGDTQYNASNTTMNFSSVDRDLYGNATLIQRRNIPKTNQTLLARATQVNKIKNVRDAVNAVPAVWSGMKSSVDSGYFESFLILGIYKQFTISLDNPVAATINLELEEI